MRQPEKARWQSSKCLKCTLGEGKAVIGEGPENARVMLIGQNPGAEEARLGRPFVGRAGKYLDRVLKANDIRRESLFITSVVKCRTPENRKPTNKEIEDCLPFLVKQIRRIKPEVIVLMGEVARNTPRFEGIKYFETFHPAAAMRFPGARDRFEQDFRKLRALIDQAHLSGHKRRD